MQMYTNDIKLENSKEISSFVSKTKLHGAKSDEYYGCSNTDVVFLTEILFTEGDAWKGALL
jgi:hypothetical protein